MTLNLLDKLKENQKFLFAATTFVAAQAIDATCTSIGLSTENTIREGVPLVRSYIDCFGITGGLVAQKVALTAPILLAAAVSSKYTKDKRDLTIPILYSGSAYTALAGSSWIPVKHIAENYPAISSIIEKIFY